jgi:hypothetical protein
MKLFFTLLMLFLAGCASDRPPSGGVADNSPLQVVFSDPAPEAINVATGKIHLSFNHALSVRQLNSALFFYPAVGKFDISVKGNDAEITIFNPLNKNQTYRLSLDKNLRDFRGRAFSAPYSLSFSTGQVIDKGTIGGTVVHENWSPAANALVLAFADQSEEKNKTANLLTEEPDYMVQTSNSGAFVFNHLKAGSYRIFAVNDRNSDHRFNFRMEESAQSSFPMVSTLQNDSATLLLRLSGLQSETGTLVSCKPITRNKLEITFSHPILTSAFDPANIKIHYAGSKALIPIVAWYSKNRLMADSEFMVVTRGLEPAKPCHISLLNEENQEHNRTIAFYSSIHETAEQPLSVTILPENQSDPAYLDRTWPLLGRAVILACSSPAEEQNVRQMISLKKKGSVTQENLHFSLIKIDSRTFALKPEGEFKPGHSYLLSVNTGALDGTPSKPVVSQFRVASKEDTGTLSGKCSASAKYVIVEARGTGTTSFYRTVAERDQRDGTISYTFPELPPGSYTVSAFIPSTKNKPEPYREWNPGSLFPYQPAEPSGVHAGAVTVRAQWTTTNIDIPLNSER